MEQKNSYARDLNVDPMPVPLPIPRPLGDIPYGAVPLKDPNEELRERMAEDRKKRWSIIEKLRNRQRRQRKAEARRDSLRMERFRRNYEIIAHMVIDSVTEVKKDKEEREAWRTTLERRMGVRKRPRITGPNI